MHLIICTNCRFLNEETFKMISMAYYTIVEICWEVSLGIYNIIGGDPDEELYVI